MTAYVFKRVDRISWLSFTEEKGYFFTHEQKHIVKTQSKLERKNIFDSLPKAMRGQVKFEKLWIKPTPARTENVKGYFRKEIYPISAVLPFIGDYDKDYDGDLIHMNSARYENFALHGVTCTECGIVGTYFAKETNDFYSKNPIYHFNLYAINSHGDEVLMTKDHIIPKSKGGANSIENYQPMCVKCNRKKGDKMPEGEIIC